MSNFYLQEDFVQHIKMAVEHGCGCTNKEIGERYCVEAEIVSKLTADSVLQTLRNNQIFSYLYDVIHKNLKLIGMWISPDIYHQLSKAIKEGTENKETEMYWTKIPVPHSGMLGVYELISFLDLTCRNVGEPSVLYPTTVPLNALDKSQSNDPFVFDTVIRYMALNDWSFEGTQYLNDFPKTSYIYTGDRCIQVSSKTESKIQTFQTLKYNGKRLVDYTVIAPVAPSGYIKVEQSVQESALRSKRLNLLFGHVSMKLDFD